MKKLFIAFFILTSCAIHAQTIDDVFKTMPANILPGIDEGNRTMLLVDTGKTIVPYPLGNVEKLAYKTDFIKLRTSAIGTTEIKLLPIKDDKSIICVIKTVCGKACDSDIAFYSQAWEKLEKKDFLPEIPDKSFVDSSKKERNNNKYAVSLPEIYLIWAEFVNESNDLRLTFSAETYLSAQQQNEEVKPFIHNTSLLLKWDKESFK